MNEDSCSRRCSHTKARGQARNIKDAHATTISRHLSRLLPFTVVKVRSIVFTFLRKQPSENVSTLNFVSSAYRSLN